MVALRKTTTTWPLLFFLSTFLECGTVAPVAGGTVFVVPLKKFASAPFSGPAVYETVRRKRDVGTSHNLHGQSGEGYYMALKMGTPPQELNILLDTGSSNFAIAAYADPSITEFFHRERSTSYVDMGSEVAVPYTQGKWVGTLGTDLVTIETLANVTIRPNIAFITKSENFFINGSNWQGIVGFAYKEIARPDKLLEPFFDSLVLQGHVHNLFSLLLCGSRLPGNQSSLPVDGTLVIGGTNPALYTGEMFYTPVVKEWYYEVVVTDIAVAGQSLGMDCKEYNYDKTIVDSGTTNLRLPEKVFNAAVDAVKSKLNSAYLEQQPSDAFWLGNEILCWEDPSIPFLSFPPISLSLVSINGSSFRLHVSPQQYIRTIEDENFPNPTSNCFKFGLASSGSGMVLGAIFLEGFYVIFDRANTRIGFAKTTCPPVLPSLPFAESSVEHAPDVKGDIELCMYKKPQQDVSSLTITAYVMAGVCGLCVLPLLIMILQWQWRRCRHRKEDRPDTGSLVSGRAETQD